MSGRHSNYDTAIQLANARPRHDFADVMKPPPWTEEAICAQVDPDLFFPDKGGSTRDAKAICRRCPVIDECLDYAMAYESGAHGTYLSYPSGVYGGLSERERRKILRERRAS